MNLYEIHKKGIYQISDLKESVLLQCQKYGIVHYSKITLTDIQTIDYRVVIIDDRLIALPKTVCRGIEI